MGKREKNHQEKLRAWTKWIAECRKSGMPVKRWCAEKGCSTTTFYRWEREILEASRQKGREPDADSVKQEVEAVRPAVVLAEVPISQYTEKSVETREKRFEPAAIIRIGKINVELSKIMAEQVVKQMEAWMRC